MNDRKSFVLYTEYIQYAELLTDEECGKLFKAILSYAENGTLPNFSGSLEMAFLMIKNQLDRNSEKYAEKCKKNRENGAKGGRPPKESSEYNDNTDDKSKCFTEKAKKPNGFSENPQKPTETEKNQTVILKTLNDNDNDNEHDNDNDINNISCAKNICTCDFFDDLWKLYPRKKGKSAVSKKALNEINAVGFVEMSKAIERYKQEIAENNTQEQYIMLGSTFFNGRYKDYLCDEKSSEEELTERKRKLAAEYGLTLEEYEAEVKRIRGS